jgi:prohibitin 2
MTWIISMILALTFIVVVFAIGGALRRTGKEKLGKPDDALLAPSEAYEKEWVLEETSKYGSADLLRWGRILQISALSIGILWIGLHTLVNTVVQVPAGFVGIVLTFKDITGQVPAGIHAVAPWKEVQDADTRVQRARFGTENTPDVVQEGAADLENTNTLVAFSSETQDVFIEATLNFRIDERDIQTLFTEVGPDYFNKLIRPRVLQIFKDTTVKFTAVEIAPSREQIREEVRRRLREELSPASIEVVDLLIDDIDFQPAFKLAIEQKQVATQDAQREEEVIRQSAAEAEQVRQTAQGTADAIAIEAAGQAEANTLLSESITDELIRFQAVQRLSPNIQVALIPSGEGIIIDPATLVGGTPPAAPPAPAPTPAPAPETDTSSEVPADG